MRWLQHSSDVKGASAFSSPTEARASWLLRCRATAVAVMVSAGPGMPATVAHLTVARLVLSLVKAPEAEKCEN